ncbi:MAG: pyridoxal phosphate-dependent aminotransferase, partial [Saprospiraceae bacterium]
MASVLSQRVQKMAESETLRMAQMARDLTAQGHNIISLSLGEPDFDTPNHIKKAAALALKNGYTKYTPVAGLMELRNAICEKFKRDNNLHFTPANIVVSNGAKQSLANLCLALLDDGDEAIVLAPYWVSYHDMVELADAKAIIVKGSIKQDFKPTAAQIEAAITPRTKVIIFSSPCNPTGSVFSYDELNAIADVVAKYPNIHIISDEIYEYINFTGKHISIGTFENVKNQVITVNGFSKGFSMTGWRIGYIGAPKFIADACSKIQSQFTSGASAFGQMAAAEALLSNMKPTDKMRSAFKKRRDLVIKLLKEIKGFKVNKPQGAFYIFPDVSYFFGKKVGDITIKNADDFCDYIMLHAHVGLVSGTAFGDDKCARISYAASEDQLREAIRRISTAVEK